MAYALLQCFDKSKVVETIAPTHWIEDKTMWWPSNKARQSAIDLIPLDKSWKSYAVLEIQIYSDDFEELEKGSYTTTEAEVTPVKKKPEPLERAPSPHFNVQTMFSASLPGASKAKPSNLSPSPPVASHAVRMSDAQSYIRSSYSPVSNLPNNCFIPITKALNFQDDNPLNSSTNSIRLNSSSNSIRLNSSANSIRHTRQESITSPKLPKSNKYPSSGGNDFKEMSNKRFQYTMMMDIKKVQETQKQILDVLSNINTDANQIQDEEDDEIERSSLMDQFERVEEELKRPEKRRAKRKMLKHLVAGRRAVLISLDALMSRGLQSKFSKAGKAGKKSFKETKHCKCIIDALKQKYPVDLDRMIGDVIKHAPGKKEKTANEAAGKSVAGKSVAGKSASFVTLGGACGNARDDSSDSDD